MPIARLAVTVSFIALASAGQAQEIPLAPLSNYGKVAISGNQSGGGYIAFEQAFGGAFDAEPASQYPEASELRRLGRAVGRLDVAFARGVGDCTAFLISEQYLMTNAHCLEGGQAQAITFVTGYVESGIEAGTRTYSVGTTPVEISPSSDLDYAILQVFGNPAAEWGTVTLAAMEIDGARDAGMPLLVMGHPVFQVAPVPVPQALYVSRKECRATATKPRAGKKLRHTCDTLVGNSGSPVFSDDSREVIALHHAGSPSEGINFAIPISLIARESEVVAELVALAPKPEGDELAALKAELERLRAERDASRAAAETERKRLADEAAQAALAKAEAERLAREKAEAERQKLADQLAALQAERDRLDGGTGRTEGPRAAGDDRRRSDAPPIRPDQIFESASFPKEHWAKNKVIDAHSDKINHVAFSPDGTRIITASNDGAARVWDAASGRKVFALAGGSKFYRAVFSPDGTRIVTFSANAPPQVWEASTGRKLFELNTKTNETRGALAPTGTRIVTYEWGAKGPVVWDAETGDFLWTQIRGHAAMIHGVAFSPDGKRLITTSYDQTAVLWDVETEKGLIRWEGHGDQVIAAAFSPDGRRAATVALSGKAGLWDVETGRAIKVMPGHGTLFGVAFSPDGDRVVTAADSSTSRLWDGVTGTEIAPLAGLSAINMTPAFSPDGAYVTAGYETAAGLARVALWDTSTGKKVVLLKGHEDTVTSVAFSPDGSRVASVSRDGQLIVWGGE